MIRLQKQAEPQVLAQNKTIWTQELMAYLSKNLEVPKAVANRYKHEEIKEALRRETYGKCMYCESAVLHVTFDHIEHIKPKAKHKYPELTFEWSNLGLACPTCNMKKGDNYSPDTPFVNPYVDDPSDHFVALGPFVHHKPGDQRGELTETTIQLNRPELIERRKERIDMIRALADKAAMIGDAILKKAIQDEIAIEVGEDKPYSFCSSSAFQHLLT